MALTPRIVLPNEILPTSAVPEGKLLDFLTGKEVNDNPEEYVRQNISKALVRQYRYQTRDCVPEVRIAVGSAKPRIDVAVYTAGSPHTQENIFVVVETKRAGSNPKAKKDGIGQLQSYMAACVNAQYGLWTNGDDRYCFAKRTENGKHEFEEIVDIPAAGQTESEAQRPLRKDLMPAAADNLLFAFRRCHNYIAGAEGMHKPDAFWELLKLIFTKIEDERTGVIQFFVTSSELSSSTAAVAAKKRIEKVFTEKVVKKYPAIFVGADRELALKPNVTAYVVSQLQRFSLLATSVDVKGIAYEEIVGSNLRGDRGEFFTPRNACRAAVRMLDPQPGDRLLDPSCGTGGFLTIAMNHALDHIENEERAQWANPAIGNDAEREELYRKRVEYLSNNVAGIDINPALVRAAKMNMVMNNDGSGGLYRADSLANPHRWDPRVAQGIVLGSFDVIFTNPPFGANIIVDDEEVLRQYDLAARWDQTGSAEWTIRKTANGENVLQKSQPPEILFIERCVQLLREGTGRMAMVVPNGILNNPALGYVRHWLLRNTQILAVVDMARELFQPKNDTQTSLLLVRRLSAEERASANAGTLDYPIFMAVAEAVGKDKRANVVYKRTDLGDDIVVIRKETVRDIDPVSGVEILTEVEIRERAVDDELPEVADAYLAWVESQR